ncbi:alanine racemase [Peribacillus sp. CSMR9]|uniref:alanine racemase n=1 Tax=Peribacillus sp. CSMR9 TaxID=2981350 RepID=UPI002952AD31|nr:alanine racemase [Peribacillus sp. CSMR9]MDV7766352.1 alanine racemase [Peribacillus sp. CSMR9]
MGLETKNFHRDTWAEVNLDNIFENISSMKNRLRNGVSLFAVVKANAYGHGDYEVAKTALEAGADFLSVAFLDEALALRKKGILAPILVLGASRPESAALAADNGISVTVFDVTWLEKAKDLLKPGQVLQVHVKVDSGMGRIGIRDKGQLLKVESLLNGETCFNFQGIFTHFATADEIKTDFYEKQLASFKGMLSALIRRPEYIHAANSAASLRFSDPESNAIRMGISMYGLSPSMEMKPILPFPLKQAISLRTKMVAVKQLTKGESVSYGATYTAEGDEWIGTLPIGYADGWIRKLQGQEVLVDGSRVPIVGRICMDQCMVKLPRSYPVGTEVTLIGNDGDESITVDEVAAKLETINYEVTCMIGVRVPRVYIKDNQLIHVRNFILE